MEQKPKEYTPGPEPAFPSRVAVAETHPQYCAMPQLPERVFQPEVHPDRARLILMLSKKWANGTVLHYYFFDHDSDGERIIANDGTEWFIPWAAASEAEKRVVRQAFTRWKNQGIGLDFMEVHDRADAEIRIGFMRGDGFWSYVGRDVLEYGSNQRTMNFGRDLSTYRFGEDTALHEIGHSLGFPHEHQNPNAGIEWDEEAVYAALAQPPNEWSRTTTFYNIIRKLDPGSVRGTAWDHDSVMHYPFEPGLIRKPETFFRMGLQPAGGLSPLDRQMVQRLYPPLGDDDYRTLRPFESTALEVAPGQQANFRIEPNETREYTIRTFGASDSAMVLFELDDGEPRFRNGDDDSGETRNAEIKKKLLRGRAYILRIRLYYDGGSRDTAVMMW